MDKEEIEALEPKYTGNKRHLTEGEAQAIVHDPNFKNEDNDEDGVDAVTAGLAFGVFRRS
ncbi:hypothetical protein ACFPES_00595 [Paenibacillus sp. GCM10023248]|uniref:hypothetical protein n=1 Tax=Bacillales TaxID=1385 RepID=UPI002378A2A9|nr:MULTISPECIES: hypothetical protein [Bacillales]MDD9265519.1 hypothetical protein [Paenibacillus sp. MAHUQ-63]MDR6885429.1 hypothetical protein [Bacillus sp. 3255]